LKEKLGKDLISEIESKDVEICRLQVNIASLENNLEKKYKEQITSMIQELVTAQKDKQNIQLLAERLTKDLNLRTDSLETAKRLMGEKDIQIANLQALLETMRPKTANEPGARSLDL
jgi:hypothetical protein